MSGKLAVWIVIGVVGAVVLGLVGGVVGSVVLGPKSADTAGLAKDLGALQAQVTALQTRVGDVEGKVAALPAGGGASFRIGVVDAETLFTRVFLPQVAAERNALQAKGQAIRDLQEKYSQGQINADAYQQQYAKLQAEYLQAQVQVNMSMLEKMIASPGFANLRADLQNLRDQAKPLADQVENLVKQAQVVILDYTAFLSQVQQLQTAFQQVDQLLTQVAAAKILEITQQVAQEQGYDLVLRTKDVVMYYRAGTITDLTGEVEKRLWNLFPTR